MLEAAQVTQSPTPTDSPGMVWVERDLKDQPLPIPFHNPRLLQTPSDLALGHFQGWRSHDFPGKSIPGPHHHRREGFLPQIPSKPAA